MAKFTFLIPAYKSRFLDQMLNSIKNQSYPDYKVIISNDCSPDDIYSICKPYLDDSRFLYRKNHNNMGRDDLVGHWNLLVNLCDTEYLIMASDDDIYHKTFLEKIDDLTIRYPDVDLLRAKVNHINEDGDFITFDGLYKEKVSQIEYTAQTFNNMFSMCIANFVFKTISLKKSGYFERFPLAWFSDTATMLKMAANGCVNTSEELFYYRESQYSISKSRKQQSVYKKVEAAISYHEWFLRYLKDCNFTNNSYEKFLYQYIIHHHYDNMRSHIYDLLSACSVYGIFKLLPRINSVGLGSKIGLISVFFR